MVALGFVIGLGAWAGLCVLVIAVAHRTEQAEHALHPEPADDVASVERWLASVTQH